MTATRATDPTTLDLFLKLFNDDITLPELTDEGMKALQRNVLIARQYLPAIMLTGRWADWTDRPVTDAMDAIVKAEQHDHVAAGIPYDDTRTHELEAHYITGLVVGLALAQTIESTRERK